MFSADKNEDNYEDDEGNRMATRTMREIVFYLDVINFFRAKVKWLFFRERYEELH